MGDRQAEASRHYQKSGVVWQSSLSRMRRIALPRVAQSCEYSREIVNVSRCGCVMACRAGLSNSPMLLLLAAILLVEIDALAAPLVCAYLPAGAEDGATPVAPASDATVSQSTTGVPDAQPSQPESSQPNAGQGQNDHTPKTDSRNAERKGTWLLAPIPIHSPAIGSGLQWAVARIFHLNKQDEVSPAFYDWSCRPLHEQRQSRYRIRR